MLNASSSLCSLWANSVADQYHGTEWRPYLSIAFVRHQTNVGNIDRKNRSSGEEIGLVQLVLAVSTSWSDVRRALSLWHCSGIRSQMAHSGVVLVIGKTIPIPRLWQRIRLPFCHYSPLFQVGSILGLGLGVHYSLGLRPVTMLPSGDRNWQSDFCLSSHQIGNRQYNLGGVKRGIHWIRMWTGFGLIWWKV